MCFYIVNNEEVFLGEGTAKEVLLNSRFCYSIDYDVIGKIEGREEELEQIAEDYNIDIEFDEERDIFDASMRMLDIVEYCNMVEVFEQFKLTSVSAMVEFEDTTKNIGRYTSKFIDSDTPEELLDEILAYSEELVGNDKDNGFYNYDLLTEWLIGITNKDTLLYVLRQVQIIAPNEKLAKRIKSIEMLDFEEIAEDKIELIVERVAELIKTIENKIESK